MYAIRSYYEFEFVKGNGETPNPLRNIFINDLNTGRSSEIKVIPNKGRGGESIKLEFTPLQHAGIKEISVIDDKGNKIDLHENEKAPYAPQSFNFKMPKSDAYIYVGRITSYNVCYTKLLRLLS